MLCANCKYRAVPSPLFINSLQDVIEMFVTQLFRSSQFAAAAVLALASVSAHAGPISFTIAGPGSTSATSSGGVSTLSYALNPAGFSTQTWQVQGIADAAGDYSFNWDYSGFHAYFSVTAFLNTSSGQTLVNAGPNNCCTTPSAGFNYTGSYTFTGLQAGDTFGFSLGGRNGDSNNQLNGTLTLTQTSQVPEPGTLALVGLTLAGLAAAGRRKKA